MNGSDSYDDYAGEFDDVAAEETEQRAANAQAAIATPSGFDLDSLGRWTGKGRAPVRPWYCVVCGAAPFTEEDRAFGACGGCSRREGERRQRARDERARNAEMQDARAVRGRRAA
ncbi:MAG: hypothetical protein HOW73_20420 [Polyangiaceae bacterium]|nr:hypothetical protein [Polyangiaceae bacterium]